MKRSMLLTLLIALFVWGIIPGFAQTTEYGFTTTMGTYTPISGGLLLGTETSDDQRFVDPDAPAGSTVTTGPGIPIGFDFMFNGASFDRLAVNNNGWISLGQSALTPSVNIASSSAYTPISSTTAIDPPILYNRIAAMARDLQAQAGATLRVETIGAAPNRVCVVQFENYKKYGTSGTGDLLNFQIRLNETANSVAIVYGSITANATNGNMQVGLRGPDATDFNARQGDGAWNATTAASANNQYVILNDVNYPASGLTFTFTYPVANAAPNPANIVSPADGATLVSPFATLNWFSGGGLPDGFRLNFGTNNPPTNIVQNLDLLTANSYTPDPQLNVSTTYYWQVVPYNAFGNAVNCPVWSFTTHGDATVNSLPYTQHWDAVTAPELPFDWTAIVQATSTSAYVRTNTTSPHSAPNNVQMVNSTDANATLLLISPEIGAAIPMNSIRVKAWVRPVGSTYTLEVGVMTNPTEPATFELVQTLSFTNTTYTEHAIPLSSYAGTGRFIAFRHGLGGTSRTIYIDDITFEEIAPNDLAALSLTGNTTPSVGAPSIYTLNVFNNGTAAQNTYTVKLMNATGAELASVAGPAITAGETIGVQIPWTPTAQGAMSIYGKVILAGDVNAPNDESPQLDISVQPEGVFSVTIGEGNLAEGVPYEFYYRNSLFQTLYYSTEMGMFGNITAINFYNNFVTDLVATPIKLWLGTTTDEDLSAGWVDPTTLTLVYDGTMNFPSGTNTITIPLQTPYNYAGGNLVLYANRPYDANYYSSSDNFEAQTVGTNRARKLTSDSTTYDPMAPSAAGTLSGTFPKTTFMMTPLSPNPIFVVNPPEKDFGLVILGESPSQNFNIANAGGGTLTVSSISISGSPFFTLSTMPTLPQSLVTGQTAPFVVTYAPTAAGEHSAIVTIVDDLARQTHTVQLNGEGFDATITTLPATENWDGVTVPNFPLGWSTIYSSTSTSAYLRTSTSSPYSAPNCVQMANSTDLNAQLYLISPP
ncbi:MAG TPA: choice-of-anchor D domain-containing protein, partial [Candidatus Cloacimonadota bacterium]|nr:choice-of-anchor D domain-containing protein [Candidatus Cloacimonadota bacterium]